MKRLLFFIEKEFVQVMRDKRTRFIVFAAPIIQLIVFGYVISTDVRNVKTGVLDYCNKSISRDFIYSLTSSSFFKIVKIYKDLYDMEKDFKNGRIDFGIIIKENFNKEIRKKRNFEVFALFDGSRAWSTQIILGYFTNFLYQKLRKNEVEPKIIILYNPEGKSSNYMVEAVIAMVLLITSMILTSISVAREKEMETIELLSISPISHIEFVLGKILPYTFLGLINVTIVFIFSLIIFKLPFRGNLILLYFGTFLFLLLILGIGLLSSIISETQAQAMMQAVFFVLPMLVLSGFFYPIESMPLIFRIIAYLNPLTHFLIILRSIFLKGSGFFELKINFLVMGTLSILIFTYAFIKSKSLLLGK
ncbi:MAG: ABC transporter permease [candidate division WOR-3 bacterium]